MANTLHQQLNLYISGNDSYTFAPVGSEESQSLTISRLSGDITLNPLGTPLPPARDLAKTRVYGIIGIVSLTLTDYVIIVTGRELRGNLMGQSVYLAKTFKVLPVSADPSLQNHPVEGRLVALVQSHLSNGLFWFSYGWDLTRRLQAQWESHTQDDGKALWEVADDRFFWNKFLHGRLIDITTANPKQNLGPYILPMMFGTFDVRQTSINGHDFLFCLISRRSRYRAGTRFFRRGIDKDGHVANFNETEQIVLLSDQGKTAGDYNSTLSFVQTRGSIPVYWAEVNNLRYKPDLQIMELQDTVDVMRLHLQEQVNVYGEQSLVNLVKHKGHEMPLKQAYEKYLTQLNLPKVHYEYFDFASECKNMKWDNISILINALEEDLTRKGYFHSVSSQPQPLKTQTGAVRTNCMDNLDRTNVVQSAVAKWVLSRQLKEVGILKESETVQDYELFMQDFRDMWADHADLISKAYSGSGALKTDFTRTGKRTKHGLLLDGYNSILRYLKNNFFDGARQDAFDLVTGAWIPRRGPASAISLLVDNRPLLTRTMPYVASFSLFMICAGLTLPRTSDYSLYHYFLLWSCLLTIAFGYIFVHGIDYVAWPRLNPPTDVIFYEGPGFRSGQKGKGFGVSAIDAKKFGFGVRGPKMGEGRRRAVSHVNEIEMGTKKRVD
ncbi:hypothetical protein BD410DRAFT_738463 [Rickenella mellea]|uniref:SAC domain-containing protein n=1 Tax=Rickenella mellea TaxID=50990 RepID=A0A4Y7QMZ3_9AGAM|nr:hypothetical protein BD410DRAFT_738463 [Rickenella mellea]